MGFEVDDDGLTIPTLDENTQDVAARVQSRFGDRITTNPLSFVGQLITITGEIVTILQEKVGALYGRLDQNGAKGVWLNRIGAYSGSVRDGAANSTVVGVITFVGLGTVNDGDLIRHTSQQTIWQAIGGPYSGTDEDIAATFQAIDAGPFEAIAGSAWTIVSSVPGFSAFTNPDNDATPGQLSATDPEFRAAIQVERYAQGTGPLASIRARISKVNTANGRVDSAKVYHNPNANPVDSFGLGYKQTHVVVETTPNPPPALLQQDIWDALWLGNGAGTHWKEDAAFVGTVVDSEGNTQNLTFDIAVDLETFIVVTLATAKTTAGDGPVFPKTGSDMADIVHEAVHARAQELNTVARDAREQDYYKVVADLQVAEQITGVDTIQIQISDVGKDGPFSAGFLSVDRLEKIKVDTVNVRVIIDGVTEIA